MNEKDYDDLAEQLEDELRKQARIPRWHVDKYSEFLPIPSYKWFTVSCKLLVGVKDITHCHDALVRDVKNNIQHETKLICHSLAFALGRQLMGID